ncbi:MAG: RNA 2',3'-cyclic phosphodiesterase [candidate division Zixibacteria bacterium]|nr:RNA 2',3'-cyclic phosphodiesterase [candidate division Zixibacteria bacterium]
MIRLFIAWPLPHSIEQELGRIGFLLKQKGGRVSWVAPNNIHLTARFLGDTDEKLIPKIGALIDEVAATSKPVECALDRLGAFSDLKRPRVIWAGLGGNLQSLEIMADLLEQGAQELGFEKETKRFRPHLTLARVRDPHDLAGLMMAVQQFRVTPTPFVFDRLTLFKSTLTPSGSIYERLHEKMLRSPAL